MKKLLSAILIAALPATGVYAQKQENTLPKLSPLTQLYLQKAVKNTSDHVDNYVYNYDAQHNLTLTGIIKLKDNSGNALEDMQQLGVRIGTKAGKVWTVQIPATKVAAFTKIKGIDYIELNEPTAPQLDEARKQTRADSVHQGIGLFCPFTGDGVVVGIVDAGFDYTHPTFFDTLNANYRVKQVWEQKTTGTPPTGFSYGNEMTNAADMWTKGTDNGQTHGTHVGGIAGGSGVGSIDNRKYRGFAHQSEMVFVGITPDKSQWINTGASDMIDGINYIFKYADAQNKPAVVNLSWGSPLGPRDGTSLFSQALSALVRAGKIFVCSSGNNGDNNIHIKKTFTATDTAVHTFLNIAESPVGKRTWIDMWGETGKTFCAQVKLYNNGTIVDSTGYVCLDDNTHNLYLIGTNNDTLFADMVTSSSEFNNKPRIFMELTSKVADSVVVDAKGTSGTIHFWNSFVYQTVGYYGTFEKYGKSWATDGNTDITISDIAASESAITIGAYASKVSFTNLNNATLSYTGYVNKFNIVPFSSHGPTIDNRIKPDIAGPGLTVASAVSSFDTTFLPTGSDYQFAVRKFTNTTNNKDYLYAVLSGTSMSSPAVSGIVALMLQANPKLTPASTKTILFETAIKDNFTGALPAAGNSTWGHGKVNAYGAVKQAWQTNSVKNIVAQQASPYTIFPNPGNGSFALDYTAKGNETIAIAVYDITGKLVKTAAWKTQKGLNTYPFDMTQLAKGTYFTKLNNSGKVSTLKTVIQ
ncbi:MAG: T9SS type A sorting domain-containing protein [Sphingobacteriales bacterium]|nr:MAG: T9SS type A sorting domain-containing protein [Sphingobacteriales bacterium]